MSAKDDKREAILKATLRLVSENGFHGTAMSKVAKEAGVSAGIIYHYFANKDELITDTYIEIKKRSIVHVMDGHDTAQPLRAQLRTIWGNMLRYFIKHPHETAFCNQFTTSPYYTSEVEAAVEPFYGQVKECFERAGKEMIIKDLPLPFFYTLISDVPAGLAKRQAAGQLELTDAIVEDIIEALWQAVRM